MTCLPSRSPRSRIADLGRVVRVAAADQLDERHDRHGAEEVHADEQLTSLMLDRLGEAVDRDRRGVAREDRGRRGDGVDLVPEALLDLEVLEHGFDDDVGVGRATEVGGGLDPCERGVALVLGEATLRDRAVQVAGDPIAACLGAREIGLVQRDRQADGGVDLGDPMAHQPGARHEHPLDLGRHGSDGTRASRVRAVVQSSSPSSRSAAA